MQPLWNDCQRKLFLRSHSRQTLASRPRGVFDCVAIITKQRAHDTSPRLTAFTTTYGYILWVLMTKINSSFSLPLPAPTAAVPGPDQWHLAIMQAFSAFLCNYEPRNKQNLDAHTTSTVCPHRHSRTNCSMKLMNKCAFCRALVRALETLHALSVAK